MAIRPTIRGTSDGRAELIRRIRQPPTRLVGQSQERVQRAEAEPVTLVALPATPAPGFRLRTAVTDEEIDAQIVRLRSLIANDNIDPEAPVGSYLNFLV